MFRGELVAKRLYARYLRRYTAAVRTPWSGLYQTKRWQAIRLAQLQDHPVCAMCLADGEQLTPATVVDHIIAHKGDVVLFFDEGNLQSLCKPHHDGAKRRSERSGTMIGANADGMPQDPRHHWNRGAS